MISTTARRAATCCAAVGVLLLAGSTASAQRANPLPAITISPPSAATPLPPARPDPAVHRRVPRRTQGSLRSVAAIVPAQLSLDPQHGAPRRGDVSAAITALPAATSLIDAPQIARRPAASYGDLFRAEPGFNVASYGQGGIGYGLSLRGYTDAEHGRDIAYFIDGVPLNEVSSLHTPNYADLNVLIPESVASVAIVRGPFSVEAGDSNLGGAVFITTKIAEPIANASLSGGTHATARGVATYSTNAAAGEWAPFLAWEGYRTQGYRDNSGVERLNAFNKFTTLLPDGATFSIRAQAFATQFGAPGYVSREAVERGLVDERSATNRSDGGDRQMQTLVANYSSGTPDHEWKAMLHVSHNEYNRYADFGGGQRWQRDDRVTAGGRISKVTSGTIGEMPAQLLVGGSWRSDAIEAFQAPTNARAVRGPAVIDMTIAQHNLAGYAQGQIKPLPWLKLTAGARYDQFAYDVDDRLAPGSTPNISPGIASPKIGVAVTPAAWLELFANSGRGFRSIDVPLELVGNPGIQPFRIDSREAGAQISGGRFRLLGSYWTTDSQNESFQPAPGLPVTFLGKARRDGIDIDARVDALRDAASAVSLFANLGGVRARLLDAAPSFVVPNVPDYVANVGLDFDTSAIGAGRLSGAAFVTFVGRKALTQDGLLTTRPYQRVTGKLAYGFADGWTAFGQATWYPGDRLSEIAINFGDPVGASPSDIVVSAQPRLVVIAGLSYRLPTASLPVATAR